MSDNVDYDEFVYYEQRVRERQKISNVNILLHAVKMMMKIQLTFRVQK